MLLYLGYPDQSAQVMNEAIVRAQSLRLPVGIANTLALAAYLEAYHHNLDKTLEFAAATARLAEEHGLPYYAAIALLTRGWAVAMHGHDEGIELIREGLASSLAIGTKQQHGYFLALLAEALNKAGRVEEALEALKEGMDVTERNNEPFYEAEMYRLKGDALVMAGVDSPSEAESCFQRAIEIARKQQAKSFELRAAMSLARLWRQQGKCEEGRGLLKEIYDWFTEGFDTPDLKDARALLDEIIQLPSD
jgi:predicted ATPase